MSGANSRSDHPPEETNRRGKGRATHDQGRLSVPQSTLQAFGRPSLPPIATQLNFPQSVQPQQGIQPTARDYGLSEPLTRGPFSDYRLLPLPTSQIVTPTSSITPYSSSGPSIGSGYGFAEFRAQDRPSALRQLSGQYIPAATSLGESSTTTELRVRANQGHDPGTAPDPGSDQTLLPEPSTVQSQPVSGGAAGHELTECPHCGTKATNTFDLENHIIQRHPNEKPYKCIECGRFLSSRSHRNRHMRTHDMGRPIFSCTKCGNIYFQESGLYDHKKTCTVA